MHTFLERYWIFILLAAVVLTRLPFLWTGYGSDADAWLAAHSASTFWNSGVYLESRLPGYPLHEIISAPMVGLGGAPLSNATTLAATLLAIVVWSKISHKTGNHKKLLVLAFAFAPVVWQHSAETLDYMWSLLFILLSLYAVLHNKNLIAGFALGIAVGFRPSNIVAIIPMLCLLYYQKSNIKQLLIFIVSVLMISVCAFIPLISKYGILGWFTETQQTMNDVHPELHMRFNAFFYRTLYFIGPFAFITSGYIFWNRIKEISSSLRSQDPIVITSMLGVISYLLLFLWLPLERAYLLPALPFFLLLIDRFASQRAFILFTTFLILSALVCFDVIDANDRRTVRFNIHPGMVIEEFLTREKLLRQREETSSFAFPEKSIIMTSSGPDFWFENVNVETVNNHPRLHNLFYTHDHFKLARQKRNPNVLFVAYIKKDELESVRNSDFRIYCMTAVKDNVESVVGYRLESQGITMK